ncbi:hypothetical protein H4Q26_016531 [Puccinia striiformis f. sp. tritici PST-130]|nr:hypothetical protein H4Q26_016531 [Puccinia striiformis f. sp. tritici PST-130]
MWPFSSTPSTSAPQDYKDSDQPTCPIDHGSISKDQGRNHPKDHKSVPIADSNRLPTDRVISSIPRYRPELNQQAEGNQSDPSKQSACPVDHQATSASTTNAGSSSKTVEQNWIYPSPSQFYNALKLNERVWRQVLEWEASYGRGSFDRWPRSGKSGPMLCSFRGRPDDLSPRAWIKVLSGYQAPFDRHDWEVLDHSNSTNNTTAGNNGQLEGSVPNLSFYLDVRPALDNWEGIRMRLLRTWDEISSGFQSPPSSTSSPQSDKTS